ncbi:MAG TPA: succinate dehydrogenase [Candidatus Limnocylindria bacterium]|nr:succinate dehydrogenase [Candidatus Limnocylindria bacterium]
MPSAAADSKTSYFLDKLHSLSGVIPIGAYLADHLWSNSYALVSVERYNQVSRDLQQVPWRILVEAGVLWIPILFHGFYGMWIWWRGKSNAIGHPWMANWLYVLQRWSGMIAFAFIGWHVYTERFLGHGVTTYADVSHAMANPWYLSFYIVGVTASAFHLGNGLWNFACKWGIAVTARAQRAAGFLGAVVGAVLTIAGIAVALGLHYHVFPLGTYAQ